MKKSVDILPDSAILFCVMGNDMKNQHIDWLNAQDRVVAPVEGTHEGYRVVSALAARDLQQRLAGGGGLRVVRLRRSLRRLT